jgi:hypothetical protein
VSKMRTLSLWNSIGLVVASGESVMAAYPRIFGRARCAGGGLGEEGGSLTDP